jgi:hypothetical protein
MEVSQYTIVTQQDINNLHSKDLTDRRKEYLNLRSTLISSISQNRTNYSILLLIWVIIYIQILPLLSPNLNQLSGRFIVSSITIFFLGIIFSYLIGKIIFYSIITKSLNNVKYHEINAEVIRELLSQNLIGIAFEKWQKIFQQSNPNWIKSRFILWIKPIESNLPTSPILINYIILGSIITILHIIGSLIWFL